MTKTIYPPTLLADFYKLSHREQFPQGTEKVYSVMTPRSNKYFPQSDKVVVFGIQAFIKKYLIDYFEEHFFNRPKEEVLAEYRRLVKYTLGQDNPNVDHLEKLHDLGKLPIKIKAIKEGTLVPVKTPVMTIENTHKDFFWLTNYLETIILSEIWQPMTSATISSQFRKLLDKYAIKTTGSTDGVDFQAHDFSMRGMNGLESASRSGAGHLLSFLGTDTIPSILFLEAYYGADVGKDSVGFSIPATEHSTMSAMTDSDSRDEYEAYKRLITEIYPSGMVSVVSDTYNFWENIETVLPKLKEEIMNRDGKLVVRPDSGNPADVLCGNNIEEFETMEQAKTFLVMDIELEAESCCGEYETGKYEYERLFRVEDKTYKIKVRPSYDRYDKRFYYVEGVEDVEVEEYKPSCEDLGLIESLWNIFGGTVTKEGYKVLDTHIGAIYGDSITYDRAKEIVGRLYEKGFASTNVVLGLGGYTFQYLTRDTFGFAVKATYSIVDGKERMLSKDPITDKGKRSQKGKVVVYEDDKGNIKYKDGLTEKRYQTFKGKYKDKLETVFLDGKLIREQTLSEIRSILRGM